MDAELQVRVYPSPSSVRSWRRRFDWRVDMVAGRHQLTMDAGYARTEAGAHRAAMEWVDSVHATRADRARSEHPSAIVHRERVRRGQA